MTLVDFVFLRRRVRLAIKERAALEALVVELELLPSVPSVCCELGGMVVVADDDVVAGVDCGEGEGESEGEGLRERLFF